MFKAIWQSLSRRGRATAHAQASTMFSSTVTPILKGSDLKDAGVYWYFGPASELPSLVDVHRRGNGLVVVFKDQRATHDPAQLPGYFDGPIPHIPPPSTLAAPLE